MSNPIANWLASLVSNGSNAISSINPLQALFANYQMQGAERDVNSAGSKANEYADFLKTQIGRTTGTADELSAALKKALGESPNAKAEEDLLNGILGGNNGRSGINALNALGDKREGWMAEDRAKLDGVMTGAGDRLDALYKSLGTPKTYGEADVNNLASDIYNKKTGAVDRSVKLASSEGFADALTRGLSDSTQAADSRDAVARRFSDVYSGLEADSRGQAVTQVGQLSDLQQRQRDSAISQLTNVINPELQARVATYRPDNTAAQAAQAAAVFGQDDLDRLDRARKPLAVEDNARTAALIGGLNTANGQSANAAGGLSSSASSAYAEALKSLGANRNAMVSVAAPAIGALTKDTLPSLINALPAALSGVASTLTQWLNSGQQEVTPEVAQAIEHAYSSCSGQGVPTTDDLLGWGDWSLPDDWFSGWGPDRFSGTRP